MAYTLEQLQQGIINADKAGDTSSVQALGAEYRRLQAEQAQVQPQSTIPNTQNQGLGANAIGAIAEPVLSMASGMGAKVAGDIAGLGAIPLHAAGLIQTEPSQVKQNVQQGLTYEPKTTAGQFTTKYNPIALVGQGIGMASNAVADRIGGLNDGTQAAGDTLKGATANFVREAIPQALSVYSTAKAQNAVKNIPKDLANKQTELNVLKEQNAATDAVINTGKSKGYKFTPDELNKFGAGHPIGTAAEDVAALHVYHLNREANALDTHASLANYGNTLKLLREDLKTPSGTPLPKSTAISDSTLNTFIKQHGEVYQKISDMKDPVVYTTKYKDAIQNLQGDMAEAIQQYPDLMKTDGLATLQNSLTTGKNTNTAASIQIIRKLRDDANRVLSSTEPKPEMFALAKLQKKAANAVEDLLGQHLKDTGNSQLFDAFQNSRTQIAKAYAIKNSLDGTVFSSSKLAKNGEGLTGNLKVIQDMQLQHPNLMIDPRNINRSGGGKASGALIGSVIAGAGHPLAGGAVAARPWLSPIMMSKMYQNNFMNTPSYQVGQLQALGSNVIPRTSRAIGIATPSLADLYDRYKK
jgi:hypothetical protein